MIGEDNLICRSDFANNRVAVMQESKEAKVIHGRGHSDING